MFGRSSFIFLPGKQSGDTKIKSLLSVFALVIGLNVLVPAQDFSKSFKVVPDSGMLEIKTMMGSVTVVPAEGNTIQINARQAGNNINASQPDSLGKVFVEVTNDAAVDLMVMVPASTSLDVLCVKCGVTVKGLRGTIKVSTTEGNISLTGINSSQVEARSMSGDVTYSGEVRPSGSYFLKSFSGRVDAALPAGAMFKLDATSGKGGIEIDLKSFQLTMQKQTSHLVQGLIGSATATVTLWTQEGSLRLKKR